MHWFPAGKGGGSTVGNDVFACSFSDGSFRILTRGGRVERHVPDAHRGACVSLRWNPDGTALATCGEDGALKTWGRNGMLRAVLEQLQHAIHALSWSPSSDAVAAGCGKDLYVKSADPGGRKTIRWKAHDGAVLAVDWSPRGDVIVSGGEDCRYRVWDGVRQGAVRVVRDGPPGDVVRVGAGRGRVRGRIVRARVPVRQDGLVGPRRRG